MDRERILKDIEEIGGKAYAGRTQLIAHLENKRKYYSTRINNNT